MSIRSFIPRKVNNRTTLSFYNMFRHIDKVHHSRSLRQNNLEHNLREVKNHYDNNGKLSYIEDQKSYTDMKYGCVTVRYSGCEIISVYNAFVYLFGESIMTFPELIAEFEQDGMSLNGVFGTAPSAINNMLMRHGFKTKYYHDRDLIEKSEGARVVIMTFYNNEENIMDMVHTVCVTREKDGYYGHNVNCNGKVLGPYISLKEFSEKINGGKSKMISSIIVK